MSEETSLVHRPVRSGALLLSLAALQFLVVLLAVEMRYPSYSFSRDTILSLGGSSSPWALAFNLSLIAFGLLGVFGLLLIASAFDSRPSRGLAFLVMLAGAIGLVGMGTFPETAFAFRGTALHVSTYVVIVAAIAGLFLLSFAMLRTERWRVSRPYTVLTAILMLAGAVLLGTGFHLGFGVGSLDWVVVGPGLLWPIVEGAHIARLHRYAPGLLVKASSA